MNEETKPSVDEINIDSTAETCSDVELVKDSDEEASDNEEEREHYIVQYRTKSIVKKEKDDIFSDPLSEACDPLEEVNKEMPIKNVVCRYCLFTCDSDYILLTHINRKHKNQPFSYTCTFPFCNFKSGNLMEWITHKGKCQNNPDTSIKKLSPNSDEKSKLEISKNQEKSSNVEDIINKEGKLPIIKVKPDYKLKSLVAQQLVLNEPKEPTNLLIKLRPPGFNLFEKANQSVLKKLKKTSSSKQIKKKHIEKCDSICNSKLCAKFKQQIDPFGDDLLLHIKTELENQSFNDHNYSKINFFQKMGLTKFRRGTCKQTLVKTLEHFKSKLDLALFPNLRGHPEQVVILNLIRQLEQIKSTYATEIEKKREQEDVNQNQILLTDIPFEFSPEKKFKLLIPKKKMGKILFDGDETPLVKRNFSENVSSVKNLRTILPKKIEQETTNGCTNELSSRIEPASSVKVLSSNLKRKKKNTVQSSKPIKRLAVERNSPNLIATKDTIKTERINSEEEPISSSRESSNLKRKKPTRTKNQKKKKQIISSSNNKTVEDDVATERTSSDVLLKENVTSNKNKRKNVRKDDQFEKEKIKTDESLVDLSCKSSFTLEVNNSVDLVHTCKKSKRRKLRKSEGKGRFWTRPKKYKACQACVEEKKKAKLMESNGKNSGNPHDVEISKVSKVKHIKIVASK